MGLFDALRKKPEEPSEAPSKSKRKSAGGITCSCGKTFSDSAKHHAHLHSEHPEHSH